MKSLLLAAIALCLTVQASDTSDLPSSYDLRNVDGHHLATAVKSQSGGTCWTHGTMAAIESNLLVTGAWSAAGETGDPKLAEYHLDWWNGFNRHFNADISPESGGLTVHEGGDYRVAAAYLARGGAVRSLDGQSFDSAPAQSQSGFHFYYVRDIEWLTTGNSDKDIEKIKHALMKDGVVGTALAWSSDLYSSSKHSFYQPSSSQEEPNHAVAIAGWDDSKVTQASKPGAWLVKNSWGTGWGENGYFWISYYDKVSGHHPQMGAVSFRNSEVLAYRRFYTHDYHGWRDTKQNVTEAFNAFTAQGATNGREVLKSVSFYSAAENVEYSVKVYATYQGGELKDQLSVHDGVLENPGLHTVDLNFPVTLDSGKPFYVYVWLSSGGHPFDRTSNVPVLLGSKGRVTVKSTAQPGESFYKTASGWVDLTHDESSANFCIKGLTVSE